MNKTLETILNSIKLPAADKERFGEYILQRIKRSKALHNPKNNFEYLRKYLADEIKFLKKEIEHTKKYSPKIFHPNVYKSRKFEMIVCQKIIDALKKVK